jgi:DNA repair protein RecN (Recombination protein N)
MLSALSIRDVVLIDRLDLSFESGLSVLTGETGAGKSILLDSLALALGARADSGLVRHGADQASVTATFEVPDGHPAWAVLRDNGLDAEFPILIRRSVNRDGRSRAWVNDQSVSATLLRKLGETLVEIHGQFDTHGLLDPRAHGGMLDAYAELQISAGQVAATWRAWRQLEQARRDAAQEAERARQEEDWLRHALAELDELAPQPGEVDTLATRRALLMNGEKLIQALTGAETEISGDRGAETTVSSALRLLARQAERGGVAFSTIIEALDRAAVELQEAASGIRTALSDIDTDPKALEEIEERLFALRSAARKHGVDVDALASLRADFARKLTLIEDQGGLLERLARDAGKARQSYLAAAEELSQKRQQAAAGLDVAVEAELQPLRLGRARFFTQVERCAEADWSATGLDNITFLVATNPGAPPGPLAKVASGGELARFMLALKVVLAKVSPVPTLVFDEVDTGIGGATADAVGERLFRLGQDLQVLVITHSPQVAARGRTHLRVSKEELAGRLATRVSPLSLDEREDEIARMLSGAEITPEARAAATRLLAR